MSNGPKCSIQVVDLSGDKPRHVKKLTYNMDAQDALIKIQKSFPRILLVQAKQKKVKTSKEQAELPSGDPVEE